MFGISPVPLQRPILDVTVLSGIFVSSNQDGTGLIDFGQGGIPADMAGDYYPNPGDMVRVLKVGPQTIVIGPAFQRPAWGDVTATGSNLTVTTDAGQETLAYLVPYSGSVTPSVGDRVLIDRAHGAGVVLGKLSTAAAAPTYVAPTPPRVTGDFRSDLRAVDSGTWYVPGARWNRNDVYVVGTGNNIGAWFYGTAPADTIPDNAVIRRVQIYTPEQWNKYPGTLTQLGLHGDAYKGGAPGVGSTVGISAGRGWKDLPTSFGDALKTGASRGIGSGISGEAYYTGRAADADSGLLRIDWSLL